MNQNRARVSCTGLVGAVVSSTAPAHADVRLLHRRKRFPKPTNPSINTSEWGSAIDGPHIIVLAMNENAAGNTTTPPLPTVATATAPGYTSRTLATATGFSPYAMRYG